MQQYQEVIAQKMTQWKGVNPKDLVLQRMTGITNEIYKVTIPNSTYSPVIFRKFGDASENIFLARQSEIYVYLHISECGLGPKIYYFDHQIRIQQYIESSVLPSKCMLQDEYLLKVGFALSKFHQLKPQFPGIKKQSLFRRVYVDQKQDIWQACHKKMAQPIFTQEEQVLVQLFKNWVSQEELKFIDEITRPAEEQGLVFSHNDLLANNVLIQKETNNIKFIDYEYASFNFPIFDMANYICQSEFNYDVDQPPYFALTILKPEDFPKQLRLIQAYVVAKDLSLEEFKANFETLRKQEKYQEEIKKLVDRLPLGMLLHNLLWGWWGIIVCKNPAIKFDYISFVKRRYDEYYRLKKLLKH